MSNRVMNLIPAAKPQPKPPTRRLEPPAEDVSFERTLKKASPKQNPKPAARANRSESNEADRSGEVEASSKKKAGQPTDLQPASVEETSQEASGAEIEKPIDENAESGEETPEIATGAAMNGVKPEFTLAEGEHEIADEEIAMDAQKTSRPAKSATAVRELKPQDIGGEPTIYSADILAGRVDGEEAILNDLEIPQGEFERSDEIVDDEIHPSKTLAATSVASKPVVKVEIDLHTDAPNESATASESPKLSADGDAGAEMQQQSFDADPSAIQDGAKTRPENISDTNTSEIETFADLLGKAPAGDASRTQQVRLAQPAIVPERVFAETNHPQIISSVKQELLPNGGTMQLRLDPPQLGALQVTVEMRDGVMTAAFQTSNEEATRLLSHSLHQLKQSLESQGVSVDRMHVQQAPRDQEMSGNEDGQQRQQSPSEQHSARQEQQRREMMQRLWRRLSGTDDFLDLVA